MQQELTVAFTLCSNNYLSQAIVLGDSVAMHQPDAIFYIGLVDEYASSVDYKNLGKNINVVALREFIPEPVFTDITTKYNIIELNTSVKPSFFKYLVGRHANVSFIYYFDPDIKMFSSFDTMRNELAGVAMILTPHFTTPIPLDQHNPTEQLALNYGLYNLGFLGLNIQHAESLRMLDWWEERCLKIGFDRPCEGLFVDQLWISLVPLFFSGVSIMRHKGLNMAPWNLHERAIATVKKDEVLLTNGEKLIFYHFSSYELRDGQRLSKYYHRYTLEQLPLLDQLYKEYRTAAYKAGYENFSLLKCAFVDYSKPGLAKRVVNKIKRIVKA